MKIIDIVHSFDHRDTHIFHGICRVRAFVASAGVIVLITDLGEKNNGQSVTNAIEKIISSLINQGYVIPPAIFIEHYEEEDFLHDTFDEVSLIPKTEWKKISRDRLLDMIGGNFSELSDRSLSNSKVIEQVDKLLFRSDRFFNSIYPEGNEVIKRKLEIMDGMIKKSSVKDLITSGCGERELQGLLKTDLSIFGEAYAKPDDEYICFSEFPLADGSIDFVVFTGRSRMDIILIEVKGADFNLLKNNHYQSFNHKINEAATQISQRLGVIYRNLDKFRKDVHLIRSQAEGGSKLHNAFLGPRNNLGVDPNKDINIRCVVIGGRTNNDLEESARRQDFEANTTPPIRVESWDTWLRRLQRI